MKAKTNHEMMNDEGENAEMGHCPFEIPILHEVGGTVVDSDSDIMLQSPLCERTYALPTPQDDQLMNVSALNTSDDSLYDNEEASMGNHIHGHECDHGDSRSIDSSESTGTCASACLSMRSISRSSTPVEEAVDLVQSPSRQRPKIIVPPPVRFYTKESDNNGHSNKAQMPMLYSPRIAHEDTFNGSGNDSKKTHFDLKRKGRYRDVFHRYTHRRKPSTPLSVSTSASTNSNYSVSHSIPDSIEAQSQSPSHVHAHILPPDGTHLQTPVERWVYQSKLAGTHRTPMHLLDISNKNIPPPALVHGITPLLAQHITDFRYNINWSDGLRGNVSRYGNGDVCGQGFDLPSFLDLVANLFPSLECLTLINNDCDESIPLPLDANTKREDVGEDEEEGKVYSADGEECDSQHGNGNNKANAINIHTEEVADQNQVITEVATNEGKKNATSNNDNLELQQDLNPIPMKLRMERLYILYRLPHLQSINGTRVTDEERNLARPLSPSGQKVKRHEWIVHLNQERASQLNSNKNGDANAIFSPSSSSMHDHQDRNDCKNTKDMRGITSGKQKCPEELDMCFDDVEVQLNDSPLEEELRVHVNFSESTDLNNREESSNTCTNNSTDTSMNTSIDHSPCGVRGSVEMGVSMNTHASMSATHIPGMFPRTGKSIAVKVERNDSLSQIQRHHSSKEEHAHYNSHSIEMKKNHSNVNSKHDQRAWTDQNQQQQQQHCDQKENMPTQELTSSVSVERQSLHESQPQKQKLDTFLQRGKSRESIPHNPMKSIGSDVAIAGNLMSKMTFHDAEKENKLLGNQHLRATRNIESQCKSDQSTCIRDDINEANFRSAESMISASTSASISTSKPIHTPLSPSPLVGSTIKVKIKKRRKKSKPKSKSIRPPPSPSSTFKAPPPIVSRNKRKNILPSISIFDQMEDEEEDDNLYHGEHKQTRAVGRLPVLEES